MEKVYEYAAAVLAEVKRAIAGKDACITKAFATILAGGHILIEDVPGVGKTTLAIAFSRVMGLLDHRVQFTPDVLPADIVGFNMYQKETGQFVYHPGTIMCNLFLADEINRTSPKTQSALLEVMEEGKVTVDGVSRKVPQPFVVIATQNPKGSAGTQLLPESQLDRFMTCMSMGYPDLQSEMEIAQGKTMTKAEDLQPSSSHILLLLLRCHQNSFLPYPFCPFSRLPAATAIRKIVRSIALSAALQLFLFLSVPVTLIVKIITQQCIKIKCIRGYMQKATSKRGG